MSGGKRFFDTNILLYLLSEDTSKADCAEVIIGKGGIISVQVLNEFASVASRKLRLSYPEIREILDTVRAVCRIEPLTAATHDRALHLAHRYGFSFYDALIVAAALEAGCDSLYTEDMQHGQIIETSLLLHNPFAAT